MECAEFWSRRRSALAGLLTAIGLACIAASALAHHSYSMFDMDKHQTVTGTVAKFERRNPHAYIWMYVPTTDGPQKHALYAFENGSPTMLAKEGWSRDSLKANDRITVEYSPLRDGKPGGHCVKVTLADGGVLTCAGPAAPPRQDARP
jgi:hypothetical protein